MFKKTIIEKQLGLHSSVTQHIEKSSYKIFSDSTSWFNVFFDQITSKIDETIFTSLFDKTKGAPNSSIRTLIAMMIIKDGQGWSDKELFEQCRFNLTVRKSMGILNLDEVIPCESTYYLLRKRIVEHQKDTSINLFTAVFNSITKAQILEFEVSGKSIRMDSKLIGSNIAFYSRYELIHKSFLKFLNAQPPKSLDLLSELEHKRISDLIKEDSSKTIYRSTKAEIKDKLTDIGLLIFNILNLPNNAVSTQEFKTLETVFNQQFKCLENKEIEIRPKEEISAQSIQSPHDTECTFRKKNNEQTKGFSHNVTETCVPDKLNLIADVQTEPASAADNSYVISATDNSQKLFEDKIENIHTDGAYHSTDNQEYVNKNTINFYCTGMQGAPSRYNLTLQANGELSVIDLITNQEVTTVRAKNNKYRIKAEKGYRYFSQKDIDNALIRKELDKIPAEINNKRNNVEATIFQLALHLRKDNTRYRGLIKNKIWAILRCLWINCARIAKFVTKLCQRTNKNENKIVLYYYWISNVFYKKLNSFRIEWDFQKAQVLKIFFLCDSQRLYFF